MEFGETMTGEQENVHKSLSTCTETVIVDGLMKYRVRTELDESSKL
jgi:hypothetical protein